MSRNNMVKLLSRIDPAFVEECVVYCPPSERNGMKKWNGRRVAVLILAACLMMALAVTAYATGAIQSLISRYWSSFTYVTPDDALRQERPDYAEWLDTQLETQAMMLTIGEKAIQTEERYQIPGLPGAGVTLLEYYYDGEKIALGCQFHNLEKQVDFSFDATDYANLPFQTVEMGGYPDYRSLIKDAEALRNIEEQLQKDGCVSFLAYDAWISDHVYANGEDLGPCHGDPDENGIFTIDPISQGLGEVELPERCRNLKAVSVSLTYRVRAYAFRLEGDTIQYTDVGLADYPVSFTIPNLDPDSIPDAWSLDETTHLTAGEALDITHEVRGTTLTIHAPVPTANVQELCTLRMQADTGLWEKMGRELVMERFPQIEGELTGGKTDINVSDETTGNLLLGFHCSADGRTGYLSYVDVQRDLNGSNLDGDGNWFTPHYLTATVPDGMDMTAEEAAQKAAQLLENYSCFRFSPWNVQAEYDRQKQQGYYRIKLQPEYQGIPVYTTIEAFYSGDGLFCCQGLMMLKESQRTAAQSPIPLKQAIEAFVNNICELATSDTVRCSAIRLGYVAQAQGEEVVLSPAWVFECTETSGSHDFPSLFAVLTEDGTLWTD